MKFGFMIIKEIKLSVITNQEQLSQYVINHEAYDFTDFNVNQ